MQVKLVTTIETFIEVDPENTQDFETAKRKIFGSLQESIERDEKQDQFIEAVKRLHYGAVTCDEVTGYEVRHSFKKVE